jgi:AraC family transcriptional regulator of adaptative response/methylated-DNA-[protein]-cysteine methyltransferase
VGFDTLAGGAKVIAAQHEAGFESASAFRAAFARLLGCAPSDLRPGGHLRATWIPTPLGDMIAVSSRSHLHLLEFVDRKALPAELRRLHDATPGGVGIGTLPPSEQATAELGDYFAARSAREMYVPDHQWAAALILLGRVGLLVRGHEMNT